MTCGGVVLVDGTLGWTRTRLFQTLFRMVAPRLVPAKVKLFGAPPGSLSTDRTDGAVLVKRLPAVPWSRSALLHYQSSCRVVS